MFSPLRLSGSPFLGCLTCQSCPATVSGRTGIRTTPFFPGLWITVLESPRALVISGVPDEASDQHGDRIAFGTAAGSSGAPASYPATTLERDQARPMVCPDDFWQSSGKWNSRQALAERTPPYHLQRAVLADQHSGIPDTGRWLPRGLPGPVRRNGRAGCIWGSTLSKMAHPSSPR